MITETGKGIIAKYMLGQAPAYASYIAIGCGAKPLASNADFGDYSNQTSLNFEMLRVPITSRGYVNEGTDGPKIVFTAELPSEERYEITEVGIYSAGSNPSAGYYGSKTLQAFNNESWQYDDPGASSPIDIPVIYDPLDGTLKNNEINTVDGPAAGIPVFKTNADNRIFSDTNRVHKFERCRFFNNMILMAGNTSHITTVDGIPTPESGSAHIHLLSTAVDLSKNALSDELRLAFSVIGKSPTSIAPEKVKIILEFSSSDIFNESGSQWARFEVELANGTNPGEWDFTNNRYVVVSKKLNQLRKSAGFAWSNVDTIKVYASVEKTVTGTLTPTDDFYVALDALRIENLTSISPLYGLTGYSVVVNPDSTGQASTIVKSANTTSFIEFRFAMDVQVG